MSGGGAEWTRAALARESGLLAAALGRSGVRTLGLHVPNSPCWVAADLAAITAGCPLVPLPGFFTAQQQRHALRDAGAGALLTDAPQQVLGWLPEAQPADTLDVAGTPLTLLRLPFDDPSRLPAGTAKVTYTSGTTGAPKGVCLSQAAMESVAASLAEACGLGPDDVHLAALPLSTLLENVGGVYAPLLAGARCVLPPAREVGLTGSSGFDPSALLDTARREGASSLILTPQMLLALVRTLEAGAPRPERLRFVAVGGATVSPRLLHRAGAAGLPVFQGYGLSECASVVAVNAPGADRIGSVGRLLPHAAVSFAPDGELLVSGACLLGYAGLPGSGRDPWPTGDIARLDEDGYLWLTGRKKAIFITAYGRNVAPEWVESELAVQPGIAAAAVFGEGRPFNTAVIVMAEADSPAARARVEQGIRTANAALPDYARVGAWIPADAPFSAAAGEITANGRARREAILARYRKRIDILYAEESTA